MSERTERIPGEEHEHYGEDGMQAFRTRGLDSEEGSNWIGEMAQWIKSSLCKHEFHPQHGC